MKKMLCGVGILMAVALVAGGCGDGDGGDSGVTNLEDMQQSININADSAQGSQSSAGSAEASDKSRAVEIYQEVLLGKREFEKNTDGESLTIDRAREIFTSDDITMTQGQFVLVDMDGDGEPEAVVRMLGRDGYPEGNLILHCEGDTVRGYGFFYREMLEIKTDGSFQGSGGAANVYLSRLSFDGKECKVDDFAYSGASYDANNNQIMEYTVNSEKATVEEYDEVYSRWEQLPDVEWYDFTEANLENMNSLYVAGSGTAAGGGGSQQGTGGGAQGKTGAGLEGQILEQSFDVELESWGKVTFASFEPDFLTKENGNGQVVFGDVRFGLVKDGELIYTFPGYNEENTRPSQQFGRVLAVAFRDYDEDGRKDILIINEYAGVQGPNIDVPFHEARVYTQEDGEKVFMLDVPLSEYLAPYADSMPEIYKGLESYRQRNSAGPQETDYAGLYVDTMGTPDVYSELELTAREDGTYEASIGLYRLTTFYGEAVPDGDRLLFEEEYLDVKGEIRINGDSAQFTVLESGDFSYISPGDVFEFPEKWRE